MVQRVVFQGADASGNGLWVTDGTAAGTVELAVAGTGSTGLSPYGFTAFNGRVLFQGQDGTGNVGLWTTDGTATGTTELNVTGASSTAFDPHAFAPINGRLLFGGADGSGNDGLWSTDGTAAGTTELPVAGASPDYGLSPRNFFAYGAKLLFAGLDANDNTGLWTTDGTAAGTTELHPAGASTSFGFIADDLTAFNGKVLFSASDANNVQDLWVTDGTSAGTAALAVGGANSFGLSPSGLTPINGHVVFKGQDAIYGNAGLWVTDGTAAGTTELSVAGAGPYGLQPSSFMPVNGKLLFAGEDTSDHFALWVTDGTAAGTTELAVPGFPAAYTSPIGNFIAYNGKVLFSVSDTSSVQGLWVSDGTSAGTAQLAVAGANPFFGLNPANFSAFNGKILFTGSDSSFHTGLWVTDGTSAGTAELSVSGAGSYGLQPADLTVVSFGAAAATSAVVATPSVAGPLRAGRTIGFALSTSAAVTVGTAGGTPALVLNDGGTAGYTGQDGTGRLLFTATVAAGQNTADLKVTGLSLGGGTITDANGLALDASALATLPGSDTKLVIDTTPPAAPTITSGGGPTNHAAQTVTGAGAEAGSTVSVLDGTAVLATATAATDGSWSTGVTLVGQGSHTLRATDTDAAGNTGPTSAAITFTLDSVAPTLLFGVPGPAVLGADPAQMPFGTEVVTGTLVSGGSASVVGQTVTLFANGVALSTAAPVVTNALGSFSATVALPGAGAVSLSASSADSYGNTASSAPVAVAGHIDAELFGTTATDPNNPGTQIAALYRAILGQAIDPVSYALGVAAVNAGTTLNTVAQYLLSSAQYTAQYGAAAGRSPTAFVTTLYQDAAGRAPDAGQGWTALLSSGTLTQAQVAVGIGVSGESIGHLQPGFLVPGSVFVPSDLDASVARFYYGVLGRTPDSGGLQYLEGVIGRGGALIDVVADALASPEYHATYGTPTNAQFVTELYQNTLGRTPDPGQGWTAMLDAGASRASVAQQIIQSPETRAHLAPYIEQGFRVA